ncbi:MAG: AAA family ATPase [Bacteroides sp.]|nr:AAA family ATPase [Bacteroides sp.]MCM1388731.1 AAA family ATPase [Bacteroides sp.]
MKFSDIPAHETAKERIRAMVDNDRIPHALLLEGPTGIGKFALARATAQYIHCENRRNGDSCGECPSCLQHASFNHIDTHFVFPIVKKKSGSPSFCDDFIEEWRNFMTDNPYMDFQQWMTYLDSPNTQPVIYVDESDALIHKLSFTTHNSKYKIALLWLPERLHVSAANKLLKQIEEPFSDTLFIMVSNNAKEILPTIYSRVQRIELKRLSDDVIAQQLIASYSLDHDDAMAMAHLAEGNMIRAKNSLNQSSENHHFLQLFMAMMRLAYQRHVKELKEWAVDISALGRETELRFLEYCMRLIRENFIMNLHVNDLNYMTKEEAAFSSNFSRFINERNVLKITDELNKAAIDIAGNGNAKIVLFDMAVRMIILLKA